MLSKIQSIINSFVSPEVNVTHFEFYFSLSRNPSFKNERNPFLNCVRKSHMKVNLSYEYNSMFQHYFITLFIFIIIITLLRTYLSPKTAEH